MEEYPRHYKKWTINEIIQLQREYELLNLSIQEISKNHKRSIRSILCKLEKEKFILDWYQAKGFEEYVVFQPDLYEYYLYLRNNNNNFKIDHYILDRDDEINSDNTSVTSSTSDDDKKELHDDNLFSVRKMFYTIVSYFTN